MLQESGGYKRCPLTRLPELLVSPVNFLFRCTGAVQHAPSIFMEKNVIGRSLAGCLRHAQSLARGSTKAQAS